MAIDVDGIKSCDEVNKNIVYTLRNFFEESRRDFFVRRVLGEINRNENFLSFGIDITNINSSFVREENPVALKEHC